MPYSLADTAGLMYSKKAFDENGYDWCMENPVGTGPFVLDEWVTDEYKLLFAMTITGTRKPPYIWTLLKLRLSPTRP